MIQQKRIRNAQKYLDKYNIITGQLQLYIPISAVDKDRVTEAWFNGISTWELLLPKNIWPTSSYNAEWKYKKLKHLPMETAYRQSKWTWKDWGWTSHEKDVEIPYQRYPREFLPPPSIELLMSKNNKNEDILITNLAIPVLDTESIKHAINLMLELFWVCFFATEKWEILEIQNIKKVNWTILPKWTINLDKIRETLEVITEKQWKTDQETTMARINFIDKQKPNLVAIWNWWFLWYLVFAFEEKWFYILESCFTQNATYILWNDWEKISKMTKQEILNHGLHIWRVIHDRQWYNNIRTYLK